MSERPDYSLICDRCGGDNGPVSAVKKKKYGYTPDPCRCGHALFRLEEVKSANAPLDQPQMNLFWPA